jgi:hypothetical protein
MFSSQQKASNIRCNAHLHELNPATRPEQLTWRYDLVSGRAGALVTVIDAFAVAAAQYMFQRSIIYALATFRLNVLCYIASKCVVLYAAPGNAMQANSQ